MKYFSDFCIFLFLLLIPSITFAQDIKVSNGASIVSTSGSYWTIDGNFRFTSQVADKTTFDNLKVITGTLTIDNQSFLTVNNALTLEGNLVLESALAGTASMVTKGTVTGANASVKRYMTGSPWSMHFLSSPVTTQIIAGEFATTGTGNDYNFYTWYENEDVWVNFKDTTTPPTWITANGDGNFKPGRGYRVAYQAANPTKSFNGLLNTGVVNYPVTTGGSGIYRHFNLAGNPYPCAIDWKAASGWDRTNLDGADKSMWIWNDAAGNCGAYSSATAGDDGTNGVTRYVASGQGFFVLASSAGNLSMNDDIKVHNAQPYLKVIETLTNVLKIRLSCSSNTYYDEVLVEFGHPEGENGVLKFMSLYPEAPELWFVKDDKAYSLNFLPELNDSIVIPIIVKTGAPGNYTINANALESFGYETKVKLEDRTAGIFTDLTLTPDYSFSVNQAATIPDRFFLHFRDATLINTMDARPDFRVYAAEGWIYIISLNHKNSKVAITDMAGRNVAGNFVEAGATLRIDMQGRTGIYIVSVFSDKSVINTKVVIQ
jgi:hypothetical protein